MAWPGRARAALLCTFCLVACLNASALAFAPPLSISMQLRQENGAASRAVVKGSAKALLAPALALGLLLSPAAPAVAQDEAPRSGKMIFDTK